MYKVSSFYIFFRFTMVNTKVTPKKLKEIQVCPVCFKEVEGKNAWTAHVIKCDGSMFVCEKCRVSFKKKEYLAKHMRLKHAENDLSKESEKDIPDPSSSWRMILTVKVTGVKIQRYGWRRLQEKRNLKLKPMT